MPSDPPPVLFKNRRQQLHRLYGFDFPDDFFRFWEFVNRLMPLQPLLALRDATDITLVGPFEVLAGRFDRHTPRLDQRLHWRYRYDPPEFFTVLAAPGDGLHWGYYLDDPATAEGCIAHYWARDAFELDAAGDNLFEAVRLEMEYQYRDCQDLADTVPERAGACQIKLREIDALRECLQQFGTLERKETGEAYTGRYEGRSSRKKRVTAATREGMGIVVSPERFRPLSLKDKALWARLRKKSDPTELVEEARQALHEGFPGTALKLGKDLWAIGGKKREAHACELLIEAYNALGREALRNVLQVHQDNRELHSVDILDDREM